LKIARSFLSFDTSSLDENKVVATSSVFLHGHSDSTNLDRSSALTGTTKSATLQASDFDLVSDTILSNVIEQTSWSKTDYNEFTLNGNGTSTIDLEGTSNFAWRNANGDIANVSSECSDNDGINSSPVAYSSETSGTDSDPYLIVNLIEPEEEPENPTSTSTLNLITCDSLAWNQKCSIVGYQYASGTLATTTEITTYQFLNLFYMIFEFFVCALVILGLIKYKF